MDGFAVGDREWTGNSKPVMKTETPREKERKRTNAETKWVGSVLG